MISTTLSDKNVYSEVWKRHSGTLKQPPKAKFIIPGELTWDITFTPFHTLNFH